MTNQERFGFISHDMAAGFQVPLKDPETTVALLKGENRHVLSETAKII